MQLRFDGKIPVYQFYSFLHADEEKFAPYTSSGSKPISELRTISSIPFNPPLNDTLEVK
jgi:hypothetical protein